MTGQRLLPCLALVTLVAAGLGATSGDERGSSGARQETLFQQARLTGDGGQGPGVAREGFGSATAVDDDVAVVAAGTVDLPGDVRGIVYVFRRVGGSWSLEQTLTPADVAGHWNFGASLAISGDTIVVGTSHGGSSQEAAYVFAWTNGRWAEQQKLTAPDGPAERWFGTAVGVAGDTIVVGAAGDHDAAMGAGAAYVFTRRHGVWVAQQKLTAPDAGIHDNLGRAVAIAGDTVVLGAWQHDAGAEGAGAAYVFSRSGSVWTQRHKLVAADGGVDHWFGASVAVSGDRALVGAPRGNAVYLFSGIGGQQVDAQKLTAADGGLDHEFGWVVALSESVALVGAPHHPGTGFAQGAAYVFAPAGGTWAERAVLTAEAPADGDQLGRALAVSGGTAVVGAQWEREHMGGAYAFVPEGDGWVRQARLAAPDNGAWDFFGDAVSLSGDTALIGAPGDHDDGRGSGAAYVLTRSGATWSLEQKLTASDAASGDGFGSAVAVVGDTAFVAAPGRDGSAWDVGAVYVFTRSVSTWTEVQRLDGPGGLLLYFGHAIALSGDTAVVSTFDTYQDDWWAGAAFVFVRTSEGLWEEQWRYVADPWADYVFGASVALDGDTAVVGAGYSRGPNCISGFSYVFERTGTDWSLSHKLQSTDAACFGLAVAISGDTLMIRSQSGAHAFGHGAGGWVEEQVFSFGGDGGLAVEGDFAVVGVPYDWSGAPAAGAAVVLERSNGSWAEVQRLMAAEPLRGAHLGAAVSLSGGSVLAGAYLESDEAFYTGAAYVFAPDDSPPTDPTVTSTSHATGEWSNDTTADVTWSGAADTGGSGLAGYSAVVDQSPLTHPDHTVDVGHGGDPHEITVGTLAEGSSYFHLVTCDVAGNCSEGVHLGSLLVDVTSPTVPAPVESMSHQVGVPSADSVIDIAWAVADDTLSGVEGYGYAFSPAAEWTCDRELDTTGTTGSSGRLESGAWYAHVCAVDAAGNWSPVASAGPYEVLAPGAPIPDLGGVGTAALIVLVAVLGALIVRGRGSCS